jgi:ABC-type transport system involved in Fe-S cluster assembly fused permease/ATPase subunit
VTSGDLTVGDAVLFLTLMSQIYGPLNFFGSYYRQIQHYMVRCERSAGLCGVLYMYLHMLHPLATQRQALHLIAHARVHSTKHTCALLQAPPARPLRSTG